VQNGHKSPHEAGHGNLATQRKFRVPAMGRQGEAVRPNRVGSSRKRVRICPGADTGAEAIPFGDKELGACDHGAQEKVKERAEGRQ